METKELEREHKGIIYMHMLHKQLCHNASRLQTVEMLRYRYIYNIQIHNSKISPAQASLDRIQGGQLASKAFVPNLHMYSRIVSFYKLAVGVPFGTKCPVEQHPQGTMSRKAGVRLLLLQRLPLQSCHLEALQTGLDPSHLDFNSKCLFHEGFSCPGPSSEAQAAASLKRLPAKTICGNAKPIATMARHDSQTVMPDRKQYETINL